MPNVSGYAALDVLIGLFFFYFVLSIVCSAVQEGIAAAFKLRAKDLERGVRNLLENDANTTAFYAHPRVQALFKPASRFFGQRKPSYLPARVFTATVLDLVAPGTSGDPIVRAQDAVVGMRDGRIKSMLQEAIDEAAGNVNRFRTSVEQSFNEVMDRASGWYKRRVQLIMLAIALVVAGGINADSFAVGQRLWKDDALRSAVVAKAVNASQAGCEQKGVTGVQAAADCVNTVQSLGLPLGWSRASSPQTFAGDLGKAAGLLATAFALMLGAPFWFDLLGKVSKLRGSGPPEQTKPPPPDAATASTVKA